MLLCYCGLHSKAVDLFCINVLIDTSSCFSYFLYSFLAKEYGRDSDEDLLILTEIPFWSLGFIWEDD